MLNIRVIARLLGLLVWGLSSLLPAQSAALKTIKLLVQSTTLAHGPVVVPVADLQKRYPDFDPASFVVLTGDAATLAEDARATHLHALPAQADDLAGGGKATEVAFETDWPSGESRVVTLEYGPEAAVAPLRPVAAPQAHALFARKYEGMGWESDRVAWRLYFDKRNAIDLYGKRRPGLSLDYFAKPGVNYEQDSPHGRDIFWNGPVALGIGSVCAWVGGQAVRVSDVAERRWKILADGPVRAVAEITYTGWKVGGRSVDLTSRLTIWAGQHWFLNEISATDAAGLIFVTGLPVKAGATRLPSPPAAGRQHRYLATWGSQVQRSGEESARVNGDNLGLAVILSHGSAAAGPFPEPADDLIAIAMRSRGGVSTGRYAVVAGWDQEAPDGQLPDAARSADAWRQYIEALNPDLFAPATVQIAPPATASVPRPVGERR